MVYTEYALKHIANLIGYAWERDAKKKLYFYIRPVDAEADYIRFGEDQFVTIIEQIQAFDLNTPAPEE